MPPANTDLEFKRGAIELLVLKSVSWGPMHGYAIAKWIQDTTNDALRVEEGSLYPALHRLEDKDFIEAYIDLKYEEVYAFEHTPHPVEFKMYYSV